MGKIIYHISDEELWNAYRDNGKAEKLAVLYERYMLLVYGVALKYLKKQSEARRLVLLVFEDLLTCAQEYDIRFFHPWLYTHVRKRCLEEMACGAGKNTMVLDESFLEFCDGFDVGELEGDERKQKVLQKCIEVLPEKQRICIGRFFTEERSFREIADATGFSLKSIKEQIQKGKCKLRLYLKEKGMI